MIKANGLRTVSLSMCRTCYCERGTEQEGSNWREREREVEMERRPFQFERLIVDLKREKSLRWQWWGGQSNFAVCDRLPLSHLSWFQLAWHVTRSGKQSLPRALRVCACLCVWRRVMTSGGLDPDAANPYHFAVMLTSLLPSRLLTAKQQWRMKQKWGQWDKQTQAWCDAGAV